MEKTILILSFFFLTLFNGIAQTVPNNSFETWITYPGTSTLDPLNWLSSNLPYEIMAEEEEALLQMGLDFTSPGATASITVTTSVVQATGRTGTYAMKVVNAKMTSSITYPVGGTISEDSYLPGFAYLYTISGNDTMQGMPYSSNINAVMGYYQFNQGCTVIGESDTAEVAVVLTKWNSGTQEGDSVGYGTFKAWQNQSSWTAFSANLVNTSGITPDSMLIAIASDSQTDTTCENTYIIVDDLSFATTTGIFPLIKNSDKVSAYPVPASTELTIKGLPSESKELQILDNQGRKIQSAQITQETATVNVSNLGYGIYLYHVKDVNGQIIHSSSFTVSR